MGSGVEKKMKREKKTNNNKMKKDWVELCGRKSKKKMENKWVDWCVGRVVSGSVCGS